MDALSPTGSEAVPRRRPVVLAVVDGVLALLLGAALVATLVTVSGLRHERDTLRAQKAARYDAEISAQAQVDLDVIDADLTGKLADVRRLTEAAQSALLAWNGKSSTLGPVRAAMNACVEAVIVYDTTAARLPTAVDAGMPARIDIHNHDTDCARL